MTPTAEVAWMQAEVLSIGTELLLGEITDTNAQHISAKLKEVGVDVYRRSTVGDNLARVRDCLREALGRADIVITSGGLGPTSDDVTAEALGLALGRRLEFSEEAWEGICRYFEARGRLPSEADRKQALVVQGAVILHNKCGTAPGQAVSWDGKLVVILPGPPREMVPMLEGQVLPLIRRLFPGLIPLEVRNLKLVGIPESRVQEVLADLMQNANPSLAPYVGNAEVRLRIAARSASPGEARRLIGEMESEVRMRLGRHVYGADDDTLESVCGELMARRGLTLATAESVTGGLLSHRITQAPGSSRYFKMGIVAYDPAVKATCLGVPGESVRRNDAVSAAVAESMAKGGMALAGADIGLSTTGFAGPGGGTPEEPVGTVYVGLAYQGGVRVDRQVYVGSRASIKESAAQRALVLLWEHLSSLSAAKEVEGEFR